MISLKATPAQKPTVLKKFLSEKREDRTATVPTRWVEFENYVIDVIEDYILLIQYSCVVETEGPLWIRWSANQITQTIPIEAGSTYLPLSATLFVADQTDEDLIITMEAKAVGMPTRARLSNIYSSIITL